MGYVIYRKGENKEVNCTVWSDRMIQQNFEKHNKLLTKHFGNTGQYWSSHINQIDKVKLFLEDWIGKKVEIIFIMQYCNKSSGYPLWRFDIKIND